ncbi:hypothetical protein WDZ92_50705, partial [Nostoc sp. NIES-2111]
AGMRLVWRLGLPCYPQASCGSGTVDLSRHPPVLRRPVLLRRAAVHHRPDLHAATQAETNWVWEPPRIILRAWAVGKVGR